VGGLGGGVLGKCGRSGIEWRDRKGRVGKMGNFWMMLEEYEGRLVSMGDVRAMGLR